MGCTITSKISGFNPQIITRTFKYGKIIFIAKPLFEEVAMKTKELELSEKIERRLEMFHAHTKLEKNYP